MNRINCNFIKVWWNNFKTYCAIVFAILTTILSFVSIDDLIKLSPCIKIVSIISIVVLVALVSLLITRNTSHRNIWKKANGSIDICYGDIFNIKTKDIRRMVVIPVNTYFDTIVDEPNTSSFPIVSSKTLHGKWINKILRNDQMTQILLQDSLYNNMDHRGIHYEIVHRVDGRGSNRSYPIGTCAMFTVGNVDYILLALTSFDETNTAHCTKDDLIETVKALLSYIDQHGQGYDCYVPIMGTGRARIGIRHDEALRILSNTMLLYSDQIHSKIHIVIYNGDNDKASIYDA